MVENIFFDFDGVILESAEIKTEAIREIFSVFPEHLDEIMRWHIDNIGITRNLQFKHIYENILNRELTEEIATETGKRFTEMVFEKVLVAPYVPGADKFIAENCDKMNLFVITGTPQKEIELIIEKRSMGTFFKGVFGGPTDKQILIQKIFDDYGVKKETTVFVGDGLSDLVAANGKDIRFIGRSTKANIENFKDVKHLINDLTELETCLKKL